jgi:hypothetical protein
MAEAVGGALPTLQEAVGWEGYRLDELNRASMARVQGVQVDAEGGNPEWLLVKLGRFGRTTALPMRDCAAGAGHVWSPYERETVRGAPAIEADQPLTREQELELCAHYRIHEGQGPPRSRRVSRAPSPRGRRPPPRMPSAS